MRGERICLNNFCFLFGILPKRSVFFFFCRTLMDFTALCQIWEQIARIHALFYGQLLFLTFLQNLEMWSFFFYLLLL